MKIINFIPSIDCGGMERQLMYLSTGLARQGHEVHVAFLRGGFFRKDLDDAGVRLHRIEHLGGFDPAIPLRIFRLLKSVSPQIAQTWFRKMDILAGPCAELLGIPWVLREPNSAPRWTAWPNNLLRGRLGLGACAIVANSETGRAYWLKAGYRGRSLVIKNALPYAGISAVTPGFPPGVEAISGRFIIYAGRLNRSQKDILTVFEAFCLAAGKLGVKAVICGGGPEHALLESLIKRRGLEKMVILTGFLPDIRGLVKKAALFVSASRYEGCPNSVLEAMACGCPLVLSDIPEHREFLPEEAAFYAPPGNPLLLFGAIELALSDGALAARKAAAAGRIVSGWPSPGETSSSYLELYRGLAGAPAGGPRG